MIIRSIDDLNNFYYDRLEIIKKNYELDRLMTFGEYLYCLKCLYEQYEEEKNIMLKNYTSKV